MDIIQRAIGILSTLTGRSKVKEAISEMSDYPVCLICKKDTKKIMEDKWCFQCFYTKSDMNH